MGPVEIESGFTQRAVTVLESDELKRGADCGRLKGMVGFPSSPARKRTESKLYSTVEEPPNMPRLGLLDFPDS